MLLKHAVWTLALVLVALAGSACRSQTVVIHSGPVVAQPTGLAPLLQTRLRSDASDTFAGLALDGDAIDVYVVGDGASARTVVDEVLSASRGDTPVRLVTGMANTLATLDRVRDQITARHSELVRRGITLTMWGPDIRANEVGVGVKGLTPTIKRVLEDEFGADLVNVFEGPTFTAAGG